MRPPGTRVAIVDHQTLFAEALAISLYEEGHTVWQVALHDDEPPSAPVHVSRLLRWRPEIALTDLELGPQGGSAQASSAPGSSDRGSGIAWVEELSRAGVAVVVVTSSDEPGRWGEALAKGAKVVLPKSTSLASICRTIKDLHQGQPVSDRAERRSLLQDWAAEQARMSEAENRLALLTRREQEVLDHLLQGHRVGEIALTRGVSESTVRTQAKAILTKLGVSSQVAAVGMARLVGWPLQH